MGCLRVEKDFFAMKYNLLLLFLCPVMLFAGPSGGDVVHGDATIATLESSTTITQTTSKAIVHWQDFSIGEKEIVNFIQPSSNAAILNRVVGGDISKIYGTLTANGKVYLVNPNGIIIGPNGTINTAQFIASTLPLSNDEFIKGSYYFDKGESKIINEGKIHADNGVYIFARDIENRGEITGSDVVMGAATELYFVEEGQEHVFIKSEAFGSLDNSGIIKAANIELKAAGGNVYNIAVKQTGVISAEKVLEKDGHIILAAETGPIYIIDANITSKEGGDITIYGDYVTVNNTILDVSSKISDGGNITIGEDLANNIRARQAFIDQYVFINASALNEGNGGNVIIWSNCGTIFLGNIEAKGGVVNGDGGFVEISSHTGLIPRGHVDTTAVNGKTGTLLFDPYDVTISNDDTQNESYAANTYTPTGSPAKIKASDLVGNLNLNNVTVTTDAGGSENGNVTISAPITWDTAQKLTITARGGITINANITNTHNGDTTFDAIYFYAYGFGSPQYGIYVNATVQSKVGNITCIGNTRSNGENTCGLFVDQGAVITTANNGNGLGSITLNGICLSYEGHSNCGVAILGGISSDRGEIKLEGLTPGPVDGNSKGIRFYNVGGYYGNVTVFNDAHVSIHGSAYECTGSGVVFENGSYIDVSNGSGSVAITGTATTATGHGVCLHNNSYLKTSTGAISITGSGGSTEYGIYFATNAYVLSTSTGTITMIGTAGGGAGSKGIYLGDAGSSGVIRSSGSGDVTLQADSIILAGYVKGGSSSISHTCYVYPKTTNATMGIGTNTNDTLVLNDNTLAYIDSSWKNVQFGDTTYTGTVDVNTAYNFPAATTTIKNKSGYDILIFGNLYWSNNTSLVVTAGQGISIGSDTINVSIANSCRGSNFNAMNFTANTSYVKLFNGASVHTVDGNVSLTGTGGSSDLTKYGVWVADSSYITSAGSGALTLNGTGGSAADNNHGIYFINNAYISSTSTGAITMVGAAGGGANSKGIYLGDAGSSGVVRSSGSGDISLQADSIMLAADGIINSTGSGDVTLQADAISLAGSVKGGSSSIDHMCYVYPKTTNTTMGIGSGASGTLVLSDTSLACIDSSWASVQFGNTPYAGTVNINTTYNFPALVTTIMNTSGYDINILGNISWVTPTSLIITSSRALIIGTSSTAVTISNTSSSGNFEAINFEAIGGDDAFVIYRGSSITTVDGDVVLSGVVSASSNALIVKDNITSTGTTNISTSGLGAITITGTNTATDKGNGINIQFTTTISSLSGAIALHGQEGGETSAIASLCGINATNVAITSSGNVTLTGSCSNLSSGYGLLFSHSSINTSGNITVTGTYGAVNSTNSNAVAIDNGSFIACTGTGKVITILGTNNVNGTQDSNYGIALLGSANSIITSNNSTISITGYGGATNSQYNYGIYFAGSSTIRSVTGSIAITGTARSIGGNNNSGIYSVANNSIYSTGSGAIAINGNAALTSGHGIYLYGGYIDAHLSTGSLTLSGNLNISGTPSGCGICLGNSAYIRTNDGNVSLIGNGGLAGSSNNHGIYFNSSHIEVDSGGLANIALTGTAKYGASNGIYMYGSYLQSSKGDVVLTGEGKAEVDGIGIDFDSASYITSNTGHITLTGIGGGSGASNQHGIYFTNNSYIESVSTSIITLIGTAGSGTNSKGIYLDIAGISGVIRSTGTGDVILQADAITLAGYVRGGDVANSHTCYIYPKTANITLGIGNSASGTLVLSNNSLLCVGSTWKNVQLGDTTYTGTVNINTSYNFPAATSTITNKSGYDINILGDISWTAATSLIIASNRALNIGNGTTPVKVENTYNSGSFNAVNFTSSGGAQSFYIYRGSSIITQNGNIHLVGIGDNNSYNALLFGPSGLSGTTTIQSGSGTIYLEGTNNNTWTGTGISIETASLIHSSSGSVTLVGASGGTNSTSFTNLKGMSITTSTVSSDSGDISLTGTCNNKLSGWGVYLFSSTVSTAGNISINGTYASLVGRSANSQAIEIANSSISCTGTGKALAITGTNNIIGGYDSNCGIVLSNTNTIRAYNDSTISIVGNGGLASSNNNHGISLSGTQNMASVNGNITITGTSRYAHGRDNNGIYSTANNTIYTSGTGTITMTGSADYRGYGVYLLGGYIDASSSVGSLIINGTAYGLSYCGIYASGTSIGANNSAITITGTGGTSGIDNHGIYLLNNSFIVSNNNITLIGTAGPGGAGIYLSSTDSNGVIRSPSTGNVILQANSITLAGYVKGGNSSISHTCYVYPKTTDATFGIGTHASGTLILRDTSLAYIDSTWKNVQLGDTTYTGTVNVDTTYNFPAATTTITNKSGYDINILGDISWNTATSLVVASSRALIIGNSTTLVKVENTCSSGSFTAVNFTSSRGAQSFYIYRGSSIVTQSGNIHLVGIGDNNSYNALLFGADGPSGTTTIQSGSGTIYLEGTNNNTWTGTGFSIETESHIQSSSGSITLVGASGGASGTSGSLRGIYIANGYVSSESGNVFLTGTCNNTLSGLGIYLLNSTLYSTASNITINGIYASLVGGIGNSKAIEINGSTISCTGTGKTIAITGTNNITGSYSNNYGVLLSGTNTIAASNDSIINITGYGSPATSEYNYGIYLSGTQNIHSVNGNITITGTARSTSGTNNNGIYSTANNNIYTTAGIIGITGIAAVNGHGIVVNGGTIDATLGAGVIIISGTGVGTGDGIYTFDSATISSYNNMTIDGTSGLTGNDNCGIYSKNTTFASRTGKVNITGTCNSTGSGYGIYLDSSTISSGTVSFLGDNITLSGIYGAVTVSGNTSAIFLEDTTITCNGTNDKKIDISGINNVTASSGSYYGDGIEMEGTNTLNVTNDTQLQITGKSGRANTSVNNGIYVENVLNISCFHGDVDIEGQSYGIGASGNDGVCLEAGQIHINANDDVGIIYVDGNTHSTGGGNGLSLIGGSINYSSGQGILYITGDAMEANGSGIYASNSAFIETVNGEIYLDGTGGIKAGSDNNHGVYFTTSAYMSSTDTGAITIVGTAGIGGHSKGIYLGNAGSAGVIRSTGSGSVILQADSITLTGYVKGGNKITQGCYIYPLSDDTSMDLGTSHGGTLQLDNDSLACIDGTWDNLQLGDTDKTTTIQVDTTYHFLALTTLIENQVGYDINVLGNITWETQTKISIDCGKTLYLGTALTPITISNDYSGENFDALSFIARHADSTSYACRMYGTALTHGKIVTVDGNIKITGGKATTSSLYFDNCEIAAYADSGDERGSIVLTGTNDYNGIGIDIEDSLLTTCDGDINITGIGKTGILIDGDSIVTEGSGSITINGTGSEYGINTSSTTYESDTGNINLSGIIDSSSTEANSYAISIVSSSFTVSDNENIAIVGTNNATTGCCLGISFSGTNSIIADTNSQVSITGNSGIVSSNNNYGIKFVGTMNIGSDSTTLEDVTIEGTSRATGGSNNHGIYSTANIVIEDATMPTLIGTAGVGTGNGIYLHGGYINNRGTSQLLEVIGHADINDATTNGCGLYVDNSAYISSVSGDVSLSGTGGQKTSTDNNHGIYFLSGTYIKSTSTADIVLIGVAGIGSSSKGIYLTTVDANGSIRSLGSGDVFLISDSISIGGAIKGSGSDNDQHLYVYPYTDGITMGLGSGAGVLQLDNTTLGKMQDFQYYNFGKIDTGVIHINTTHSFAASVIVNGSSIIVDGSGSGLTSSADITFICDSVSIASDVVGGENGIFTIYPNTALTDINIGNVVDGTLVIDATSLSNIIGNFDTLIFGDGINTDTITIQDVDFQDINTDSVVFIGHEINVVGTASEFNNVTFICDHIDIQASITLGDDYYFSIYPNSIGIIMGIGTNAVGTLKLSDTELAFIHATDYYFGVQTTSEININSQYTSLADVYFTAMEINVLGAGLTTTGNFSFICDSLSIGATVEGKQDGTFTLYQNNVPGINIGSATNLGIVGFSICSGSWLDTSDFSFVCDNLEDPQNGPYVLCLLLGAAPPPLVGTAPGTAPRTVSGNLTLSDSSIAHISSKFGSYIFGNSDTVVINVNSASSSIADVIMTASSINVFGSGFTGTGDVTFVCDAVDIQGYIRGGENSVFTIYPKSTNYLGVGTDSTGNLKITDSSLDYLMPGNFNYYVFGNINNAGNVNINSECTSLPNVRFVGSNISVTGNGLKTNGDVTFVCSSVSIGADLAGGDGATFQITPINNSIDMGIGSLATGNLKLSETSLQHIGEGNFITCIFGADNYAGVVYVNTTYELLDNVMIDCANLQVIGGGNGLTTNGSVTFICDDISMGATVQGADGAIFSIYPHGTHTMGIGSESQGVLIIGDDDLSNIGSNFATTVFGNGTIGNVDIHTEYPFPKITSISSGNTITVSYNVTRHVSTPFSLTAVRNIMINNDMENDATSDDGDVVWDFIANSEEIKTAGDFDGITISGSVTATAGSIEMEATSGDASGDCGIYLHNGEVSSLDRITLIGYGVGENNSYGIYLNGDASIFGANTELYGDGSGIGGDKNHGIYFDETSSAEINNGTMALIGVAGIGSHSYGIKLGEHAAILGSDSTTVILQADSMTIDGDVIGDGADLCFMPYSMGYTISLGVEYPGVLSLDNNSLSKITGDWANVYFGSYLKFDSIEIDTNCVFNSVLTFIGNFIRVDSTLNDDANDVIFMVGDTNPGSFVLNADIDAALTMVNGGNYGNIFSLNYGSIDQLDGGDGNNTYYLAGGDVTDFINGGSHNDSFVFLGEGVITGRINGGSISDLYGGSGGIKWLDYTDSVYQTDIILTTDNYSGTGTGLGLFTNINKITGSSSFDNSLTGCNTGLRWRILGTNSGMAGGLIFENFANLIGGTGNDRFILRGGTVSSIDGGEGENILYGDNINNYWTVKTMNGGTLNSTTFSHIQSLIGGSKNDYFLIYNQAGLTHLLDGGRGYNILDYSMWSFVTVNLLKHIAKNIGYVTNIQEVIFSEEQTRDMKAVYSLLWLSYPHDYFMADNGLKSVVHTKMYTPIYNIKMPKVAKEKKVMKHKSKKKKKGQIAPLATVNTKVKNSKQIKHAHAKKKSSLEAQSDKNLKSVKKSLNDGKSHHKVKSTHKKKASLITKEKVKSDKKSIQIKKNKQGVL